MCVLLLETHNTVHYKAGGCVVVVTDEQLPGECECVCVCLCVCVPGTSMPV